MDPRNPAQGTAQAAIDETRLPGVAQVASRFTGTSTAQPEYSFHASYANQQERARQATTEAKSLQHAYRGKGDDWMSEFERMRRLEMQAARRAEQEARDNLHRYRGNHALILAFQRAKLGLPLTAEQSSLLRAHAAELNLPIMFTQEQIEAEREKALQELLLSEQQMLESQGKPFSSHTAISGLTATPGEGPPPAAGPIDSTQAWDTFDDPFAAVAPQQAGYASGVHGIQTEAKQRALPSNPFDASADSDDEAETSEAEDLMMLITKILQEYNRALTLGEVSSAIADRTGYTWGGHFEALYGPLLQFLKAHRTPGYHIISYNKYLSLPGMEIPPQHQEEPAAVQSDSPQVPPAAGVPIGMAPTRHYSMSSMPPTMAPGAYPPPIFHPTAYPGYGDASMHMFHTPGSAPAFMPGTYGAPPPMQGFHYPTSSFYSTGSAPFDQRSVAPQPPATGAATTTSTAGYDLDEFFDPAVFRAKNENKAGKALATSTVVISGDGKEDSKSHGRRGSGDAAYDGVFGTSVTPEQSKRKTTRLSMTTETMTNAIVEAGSKPAARQAPPAPTRQSVPEYGRHHTASASMASMQPAPTPGHGFDYSRTFDVEEFARRAVDKGATLSDDSLTWQDFDILFRPILVHSFILIKHGRSGLPKRHRFWMNNSLNRLYWDTTKFVDLMKTGERHIDMLDVVGLMDGAQTDLLRRRMGKGEISASRADRFFSLITTSRTFDLEALSVAQKRVLVRAFNFLIKHLARPYTGFRGVPPPGDSVPASTAAGYGYY